MKMKYSEPKTPEEKKDWRLKQQVWRCIIYGGILFWAVFFWVLLKWR